MHETIAFECDYCGYTGAAVAHRMSQIVCPLCENPTHFDETCNDTSWELPA